MKKNLLRVAACFAVSILVIATSHSAETVAKGDLVEKQKSISGSWSIEQDGDTHFIVLGENFKAKKGPDLKLFLSPIDLATVNGKTATKGSVFVANLKSVKGSQRYPIPSAVDLTQFKSLLIHCEKYAILWGGGSL